MHLCFVDESGSTPKPNNARLAYFAIAGLIIPEAQWRDVAREFQQIKDRPNYRVRGEIKWRYFGAHNDDPKNTLRHLDQQTRDQFRSDIFNILTKRNSIKIIACVSSIRSCYALDHINHQDDLYEATYKPITERFQYFLQDIGRETGSATYGMIIADHRGRSQDERLKKHHQKLMFAQSPTISNYKNLIEGLFLTESHGSVGVQLADMVAGAIGRRFNSDDAAYYDQIVPAFRTGRKGGIEGYGLVKMPTAGWE